MIAYLSQLRVPSVRPFSAGNRPSHRLAARALKTRAMANPLFDIYVKGQEEKLGDCASPLGPTVLVHHALSTCEQQYSSPMQHPF